MTLFQLIMLAVAAFFAYQVYVHIQNIDEDAEPESMRELDEFEAAQLSSNEQVQEESFGERIEQADQAYMEDDLEKARELLEGIVNDFPTMAEGMNKLAFVLSKLGEKEEALLYYRASLRIDDQDDMTHNAIARLLSSMDKTQEAKEHFDKAVEIDDNDEVTWYNYANFMLSLGKIEEAKEMFQKALTINPSFEEAKEELERLG